MRLEHLSLILAHYRVYSLPCNGVLILGPGAPFPAHVVERTAIAREPQPLGRDGPRLIGEKEAD
jgi:hypothetical protein